VIETIGGLFVIWRLLTDADVVEFPATSVTMTRKS
jgi:hypothetical protein